MTVSGRDLAVLAGIYLSVKLLASSLPQSGSWAILQSIIVSIASIRAGRRGSLLKEDKQ